MGYLSVIFPISPISPISGSFVQPRADLSDEDASKLGMKNEDDEVEKFVMANTQVRNSKECFVL